MFKYLLILALLPQAQIAQAGSSMRYAPVLVDDVRVEIEGVKYQILPPLINEYYDERIDQRPHFYWKMKTSAVARGKPLFDKGYYWFAFLDGGEDGNYALLATPEQKSCLEKCWEKYEHVEMIVFPEGVFYQELDIGLNRFSIMRIKKFVSTCK